MKEGLGPSIVDGKVRYLSVSQLEKFDPNTYGGCERRWWFRYVAKQPEPQKGSQKLGTQCHSQIEHYLKTGEDVLGEVVRAGKRFLPSPGADLLLEHQVNESVEDTTKPVRSGLSSAGVPFVGYIDVLHRRGEWINDDGETVPEPNTVEAIDWKTTVQISDETDAATGLVTKRGYAKSENELANTWQMIGYAAYARHRWGDIGAIRVSHGVFQTKGGRAAKKTSKLLTVSHVDKAWKASEAVVERMKATADIAEVASIPPNLKACNAYGGCPHKSRCPRDAKQVLAELFATKSHRKTNSACISISGCGISPVARATEPQLSASDTVRYNHTAQARESKKMSLLDRMKAKAAAPASPVNSGNTENSGKSICEVSDGAVAAEKAKLLAEEATRKAPAVTPPDVPAPQKTHEPIETVTAAPEAKKSRKKAETPKEVAPSIVVAPSTLVLYMDASEDGVAVSRLETYVENLAVDLAKTYGAADIRCAPKDSPLAYGQWKGALAAMAKAKPPEPGAYAVSMSNELAAAVAEALAHPPTRVVRGHR